jgi:hypothetical protein
MSDSKTPTEPKASRPHMPGYGIPKTVKGLLPWSHVDERMTNTQNYWIATVSPNGSPHVVPVWGLWVENALYFSGGADTRWMRNLAQNPAMSVHLDSSEDVVTMEGVVERLTDPQHPIVPKLDAASKAKYQMGSDGVPCWVLKPRIVFAWRKALKDATRWEFDPE